MKVAPDGAVRNAAATGLGRVTLSYRPTTACRPCAGRGGSGRRSCSARQTGILDGRPARMTTPSTDPPRPPEPGVSWWRMPVATLLVGVAGGAAGIAVALLLRGVQHLAFGYTTGSFLGRGGSGPRLAPGPRPHHGRPARRPRLVVAAPAVHRRGRVGDQGAPRTRIAAAGARHHGGRGSADHRGRCRRVAGAGGGAQTDRRRPGRMDRRSASGVDVRSAGRCWPAAPVPGSVPSTTCRSAARCSRWRSCSPPSPGGTSLPAVRHLGHRHRAGVAGALHPSDAMRSADFI